MKSIEVFPHIYSISTKIVLSSLFSLTALATSTTSSLAEELNASIGINTWIGFTPLYIAREKGFFVEEGLDLDVQVFSGNDNTLAFAAGRIDGFASITSEAVLLKSRGKDFRIVLVEDFSLGADGILARNTIPDIAGFSGQRIAVEEIGVSHFFLLQVLDTAGLTESDVTLVNLKPESAAAAYQSGQIDIAVTYAPFLDRANQAVPEGRIIFDTSEMPTAITDLYIFDTKFTENNPDAIKAFVRGIFRGIEFLDENPEEGLAIAADELGITPEELAADLEGIELVDLTTNLEVLGNPDSDLYLLKPMNDMATFLFENEQIDRLPELEETIDPQFVNAIQENQ